MISERERQNIIAALRNIVFLEDDETGEEYCEVNDILNALNIHAELGEYLYHDDVNRLVDIVSAKCSHGFIPLLTSSVKPHRYALNVNVLKTWMIENNVTSKRLCDMIGVTTSALNSWINKGTEPRVGSVLAIAYVTGIDIYDLMQVVND